MPEKKVWTLRPKALKKSEERKERERAAEERLEYAKCALDDAVCEQARLRELRPNKAASA